MTPSGRGNEVRPIHFYSHASCEAWRIMGAHQRRLQHFYSHASCEAWLISVRIVDRGFYFYSHASCEAWPHWQVMTADVWNFYSHASCEAWPAGRSRAVQHGWNFYSHASCEAWQADTDIPLSLHNFYSHASCEAWQITKTYQHHFPYFYSHASCEAWPDHGCSSTSTPAFLLTCLLRGMTGSETGVLTSFIYFYSHASCEAWRYGMLHWCIHARISTHMPLARHDPFTWNIISPQLKFLLTCLLRGMTATFCIVTVSSPHI